MNHRKYSFNFNFFNNDSPECFYIAGFIAADGTINSNKVEISLNSKDRPHLEKLNNILESTYPIRDYEVKKYNVSRITIYHENLGQSLEKFNIIPNKSLTYKFPSHVKNHPLAKYFILGYSDGDFCWTVNNQGKIPQMRYKMIGTESFLKDTLVEMAVGNANKVRKRKDENVWRCEFGGNNICGQIANYLYSDATIYLDRKYDKIKHLIL